MAPHAPATVDELGLQGCLYLWALLTGQQRRLPIAPTKRMTLVILALLQDQGVIEVPWPQMRWEFKPDAHTTPIEGLQWRLAWTVYEPGRLLEALDDYFDTLERDDFVTAFQLRLWTDIGSAETERFFEQQLRQAGIQTRHSRLQRPNDNAHIERFNRTIQTECIGYYWRRSIPLLRQREKLSQYIDFYNKHRVHLGIQLRTPAGMLQRS